MASKYHTYETNQQLAERILATDAAGVRDAIWQEGQQRLEAFLALPAGHRAIVWRQLSDAERRELVEHQLVAAGRELSDDTIAGTLDGLNDRWGTAPTTTERATYGALDELVDTAQRSTDLADGIDQQRLAQRELNAAQRARQMVRRGYMPEQIAGQHWRIRSAHTNAFYTIISGACDCVAGQHGHACWHVAAIAAIEIGIDQLSTFDSYVAPEYAAAAVSMGRRLARARQQYAEVW